MARRDQQMRDHPDRVGSAAAGGEEAESGDLDGVPLGKEQGIGGLVEYVLPHALAEGAFPDDQARPGIPHPRGEQLGGAGSLAVGQKDDGGIGAGRLLRTVALVTAAAVPQQASTPAPVKQAVDWMAALTSPPPLPRRSTTHTSACAP